MVRCWLWLWLWLRRSRRRRSTKGLQRGRRAKESERERQLGRDGRLRARGSSRCSRPSEEQEEAALSPLLLLQTLRRPLSLSRSRRASPRCPSSLLLPSSHRSARDARERPRPWRVPFVFFSLLVVRARVCLVRAWHLAAALPPRVACSDTPPLARSGARRAPQWCEACGECVSE